MNTDASKPAAFNLQCPVPKPGDAVQIAHGGGGRLMHRLLDTVILPALSESSLDQQHDGATLQLNDERVVFTTDSFVVSPLFFPGGNIGSLAVNGTVNDLLMCGAKPQYLSVAFILEAGLALSDLQQILQTMRACASQSRVQFVTGDTKVVEKGKGDGIYINTAGIGTLPPGRVVAPSQVRAGQAIVVSSDLGRHGMAIMACREGLEFESPITSDCRSLLPAIQALREAGVPLHCMRDCTRGGLASTLNEIATAAGVHLFLEETRIPVTGPVKGACEILGLDPLYVANEGCFVLFTDSDQAETAAGALATVPGFENAKVIGRVTEKTDHPLVILKSVIGAERILDLLSGEQLPRIC